jgi:predicted AAA+ superfamily ATPase
MTFRDFLVATRSSLALPESVHPSDLQSLQARAALEGFQFQVDDYDLAWQDFLACGGFPRAVAEHRRDGAVSDDFLRDIAASLRGDIQLDGAPQSLPLLLSQLETRSSSPLNIASVAL